MDDRSPRSSPNTWPNWRRGAAGLALASAIAGLACAFGGGRSGPAESAPSLEYSLEHEGIRRTYRVHVPPGRDDDPLPLVLSFHGGGGNAAGHEAYTLMDEISDLEGFLVVYPDGTGRWEDRFLTWNAGGCCGEAMVGGVDDVGFVRALLGDVSRHVTYDPNRVYATGLSNGAMMAYRIAIEASDLVTAIAPVAGAMRFPGQSPGRPVPLLHFHSVDDPRAHYEGGPGALIPGTDDRSIFPAVEDVIGDWVGYDGCAREPEVGSPREITEAGAIQTATLAVYAPCTGAAEVRLWKMTGVGHVWPGGQPDYLTALLGPSTGIVDANREMWEFFRRYASGSP